MSDSPLSIALTVLSGGLGAASSGLLLHWAAKNAPKQRIVAAADAIDPESALSPLADKAAAPIRAERPALIVKELEQVKLSAALLLLSFLVGLVAPFV